MSRGLPLRGVDPDALLVECWCHREFVWVDRRAVRDGLTVSCGAVDCRGPRT